MSCHYGHRWCPDQSDGTHECPPPPRTAAIHRPAGWRDPLDTDPEIRDEFDPIADDLRHERAGP